MPYSIGGGRGERAAGVPAQSGPLGDIADAAPPGAVSAAGPTFSADQPPSLGQPPGTDIGLGLDGGPGMSPEVGTAADPAVTHAPVLGESPVLGHGSPGGQPVGEQPGAAAPPPVLNGPPLQRLAQLGLELPPVPAPLSAYVPAVRSGSLVFSSGQLPFVAGELIRTGTVGDQPVDVSPADAASLARTCALNALAAIATVVDLDHVRQVVKVTGFVASAPGFGGQPGVVDGASELLGQVFGDAGRHARAAVGAAQLPLNSPVEIEVVVEVA